MKRIAIFCVTYNSYNELTNYLSSIDVASKVAVETISVDVFIADNTEKDYVVINNLDAFSNINCQVFPYHQNLGYFGGIQSMMKNVNLLVYDYIALTNVDLTISEDAFIKLVYLDVDNNVGWIAPAILSEKEGRDRNPSVLMRYSKLKLMMLKFKFDFPLMDFVYNRTFYKRKQIMNRKYSQMDIYAGHGSFILLTKQFFQKCGLINYPIFLFGEELYLAEECRKHSLRVVYNPSIKIYDKEHVSTGKMKRNQLFIKTFYHKCNSNALGFILNKYY